MDESTTPVGMYEVLDAIEGALKTADPTKLKTLAETLDAYADDFAEDFFGLRARGPRRCFTTCL